MVDVKFDMSWQCVLTTQKANRITRSVVSKPRQVTLPLYSALMRPCLEYQIQICCPQYKKDVDLLIVGPEEATKMTRRLKHISCEERLREMCFIQDGKTLSWPFTI